MEIIKAELRFKEIFLEIMDRCDPVFTLEDVRDQIIIRTGLEDSINLDTRIRYHLDNSVSLYKSRETGSFGQRNIYKRKPEWIDVKKKVPEFEQRVLVLRNSASPMEENIEIQYRWDTRESCDHDVNWVWEPHHHGPCFTKEEITHWMPLPEPPNPTR